MPRAKYDIARLKTASVSGQRTRFLIHHNKEFEGIDLTKYTVVITAENIHVISTEAINESSLRAMQEANEDEQVWGDRSPKPRSTGSSLPG